MRATKCIVRGKIHIYSRYRFTSKIYVITFNAMWFAGINGFLYGNLPGLSMCQGSKIYWHMFGLGNEVI